MRLLILLLISAASASDLDLIPFGDFGTYDRAMSAARRAALIQTGIDSGYEGYKSILSGKAMDFAKDLGFARPLGAGLYLWKLYQQRSVSFPTGNNKRLTLRPDGVEFRLEF